MNWVGWFVLLSDKFKCIKIKLQLIRKWKRGRNIDMLGNIKVVVIILYAYGRKNRFDFFANVAEFSSEKHYNNWIYLFSSHWSTSWIKFQKIIKYSLSLNILTNL